VLTAASTLPALLLAVAAGPPVDVYGDPLPPGAVARLGSARLRHADLADYVIRPDGRAALTVGHGGVREWDLATGRLVRQVELDGADSRADDFRFDPAGRVVAGYGLGPDVAVWDAGTGRKVTSFRAADGPGVAALAVAPNREAVAAAEADGRTVTLVEWKTGRRDRLTFPRPAAEPSVPRLALAFSPDGRRVAVDTGGVADLCVFDAGDRRLVARAGGRPAGVGFSPDGTRLAATAERAGSPVLILVDLATGRQVAEVGPLPGGQYPGVAFAPDGRAVACGGSRGGCLVDLVAGRVAHVLDGGVARPGFTADGGRVVACEGNRLRVWDRATGREVDPRPGDFAPGGELAVSPDGRSLVSIGRSDGWDTSLWDLAGGRLVRHLRRGPGEPAPRAVGFSADGRTVRAVFPGRHIRGWDVGTGTEGPSVQLAEVGTGLLAGEWSALSTDGRRAFTVAGETLFAMSPLVRSLEVWDTGNGTRLARHTLPANRERVSPEGWVAGRSAVAARDGAGVLLVDTGTGRARVLPGTEGLGPVAFSPDGRLLAAPKGSKGRAAGVGVWEVSTGREVMALPAGPVRCLALAPDTRTLVCSTEWFVSAWDLATGAERARWAPPGRPDRWWEVSGVVATPDGGRVVTTLRDGSALVWAVPAAGPMPAGPADAAELSATDPGRAYRAVWRLAERPAVVVVPLVRGWVVRPAPDPVAVRQCVAGLDAAGFRDREAAEARLVGMGTGVAPALRAAVRGTASPEVRERLDRILARLERAVAARELLTERAAAVLERVGTADARAVLAEVAAGPDGAAARAALDRLGVNREVEGRDR